MRNFKFESNSENETYEIGKAFAKTLSLGSTVCFYGDLGAGKTEFIKGICDELDVKQVVTSPTFNLMNKYDFSAHGFSGVIYHVDLYRIEKEDELFEIGFNECIHSDDVIKLVEWSEKAEGFLPDNRINITILSDNKLSNKRFIKIEDQKAVTT